MDLYDQKTLELTLKASNEGIWDWWVGEDKIYYSEKIYSFFGVEPELAPNIMTHPELLLHKADIADFKNILRLTLMDSQEEFLGINCRIVQPDKSVIWLRIRGIVVWEGEDPVRIAGSMINISKRKLAENLIQEERNMLRLVIDNIPLQVYFKDTESNYVLVNQRQADWLGLKTPEEVHGKSGADFFSNESWDSTRNEEIKIMKTGIAVVEILQKETWLNRTNTFVKKTKYPWYDSSGNLLGTFGISCDVTSLFKGQQKLEDLAMNLKAINKNYEEELVLAREIQHAILPENSNDWDEKLEQWSDRLNITQLYIPATHLAGDYYDIITVDENRIGFLIVDVMGHGVRSALIVSLIRGLLEQAHPYAHKPSLYLEQINFGLSTLLSRTSSALFASASYCVLDFSENTLAITCAGHDSPLIELKNTNPEIVFTKEPALGFFPDAKYSETVIPLDQVKKILLYTDGIYEAENIKQQDWGQEQLKKVFKQASKENDLEQTKQKIYKDALDWVGELGFNDDVCMLGAELK